MNSGTMADYSFGGTDEENAELKKLNAEVVCLNMHLRHILSEFANWLNRMRSPIASIIGRSSSALQNLSRVVSTGTRTPSQSLQLEIYTIVS